MHYNVHDFPIELQDISNRIYTSNFSYLLVFCSWHMHNVLFFFVISFTSFITDDYQSQQYIIMYSIMHPLYYCRQTL